MQNLYIWELRVLHPDLEPAASASVGRVMAAITARITKRMVSKLLLLINRTFWPEALDRTAASYYYWLSLRVGLFHQLFHRHRVNRRLAMLIAAEIDPLAVRRKHWTHDFRIAGAMLGQRQFALHSADQQ